MKLKSVYPLKYKPAALLNTMTQFSVYFVCVLSTITSISVSASNYGTTGLIEVPSARMQPDGTFSFAITHDSLLESYAITYQAFPWLEGTFRYTGTKKFFHWDRNYEVKARLLAETQLLPQISVGIRDLVGTGLFGSEYIVANKRWGNLDVTLGLGWGRLSNASSLSNPLTTLSEQFGTRKQFTGLGGELSTKTFFRGQHTGIFGGVAYRFDDYPVTLQAEYNPDENRWEGSRGIDRDPQAKSPLSYGLIWHMSDTIDISVAHQHLDHLGIGIQVRLDTKQTPTRYSPAPFFSSLDKENSNMPEGLNPNFWYDNLLFDIERSDLFLLGAKLIPTQGRAEIEINNDDYAYWPDALKQAHILTSLHLPKNIKQIDYIINEQGHALYTVRLARLSSSDIGQPIDLIELGSVLPGRVINQPNHITNFVKDRVHVDVELDNRLMLFDPDNPLAFQIFANVSTKVDLPQEWMLRASYRVDVYNNIDTLSRVSNSVLPHVRSDSLKYLQQGQNGIQNIFLEKRDTFAQEPQLHYRVFGGILEDMYSGVGGEIMYQPHASRLAFALSGAYAIQRDYDGGFEHLDYKVLTGHASVYWASPFYNYDIALHAGRYLAEDLGATIEVRRTFDNGWQIGLWATKTNVSAQDFGEGSFDKGMFFRIPFDSFFQTGKKSAIKTRIRPIQRDGGARLEGFSGDMWWELRDARFDMFSNPIRR
jgi:hypothetical protein